MPKQAISVTLEPDNLIWLRAQTVASGARSLSEALDRVLRDARRSAHSSGPARSVRGTIEIDEADPGLATADITVRDWFERSRSRAAGTGRPRRRRPRGRARGRG